MMLASVDERSRASIVVAGLADGGDTGRWAEDVPVPDDAPSPG